MLDQMVVYFQMRKQSPRKNSVCLKSLVQEIYDDIPESLLEDMLLVEVSSSIADIEALTPFYKEAER